MSRIRRAGAAPRAAGTRGAALELLADSLAASTRGRRGGTREWSRGSPRAAREAGASGALAAAARRSRSCSTPVLARGARSPALFAEAAKQGRMRAAGRRRAARRRRSARGRDCTPRRCSCRRGAGYDVGATEYGGPGDPSSRRLRVDPRPARSPTCRRTPTASPSCPAGAQPREQRGFTFADANALDDLPYMSALRVATTGTRMLLYKRDIGYGQGPGRASKTGSPTGWTCGGRPPRRCASPRAPCTIALAPASGAAATLEALPETADSRRRSRRAKAARRARRARASRCRSTPGSAHPHPARAASPAAGEQAPAAVKAMVAAGNRLYGTAYLYGGGHGTSLNSAAAGV